MLNNFEIFCKGETEQELLDRIENLKNEISLGLDIDKRNKNGDTELHVYVKDNFYPTVRVYCEAGANVNIKDNKGDTPLNTAISNKNKHCIKNLGKEPVWINDIISILLKYGAIE